MIKLFCAIVGVEGSAVFPVDIDPSLLVIDLKDSVKEKNEDIKVPARVLQLFLAKKDDNVWLTENDVMSGVSNIRGMTQLKFAGAPLHAVKLSEKDVQIKVSAEELAAGKGPIHVLVVVPVQGLVPTAVTVPTKKRKLDEMRELITPSSFAKCKGGGNWVKWLKKLNGQIECHSVDPPDDNTPIVLLNETFARFEENCKQIEFGQNDCEFVSILCHGLSAPYDSEAELAAKARELLTEYLLPDNASSTITPAPVDGSVPDGSYRCRETLLLNLECKLQKGDGGGDPTMQNVASRPYQT